MKKDKERKIEMYIRPIKQPELVKWLLDNGFAEEESGHGHVDAETLAQALITRFDVLTQAKDPV
jgi:hypothetical protein